MASVVKYTNCLLMLWCLSCVWVSYAQAPQDVNVTKEITATLKTDQKEFMVTAATTSTIDHKGIIAGRKMALHKVMRPATVQPLSGSNSNKVSACSNNLKFSRKKKWGDQKVNCKKTVGRFSAEIDETAGFVAFNADYRAPRHHPPKNN